jgi:hypothetical protein
MNADYLYQCIKVNGSSAGTGAGIKGAVVDVGGCYASEDSYALGGIEAKAPGTETVTLDFLDRWLYYKNQTNHPDYKKTLTLTFHVTGEALPPTPTPDKVVNDGPQDTQFKTEIEALINRGISTGVVDSEGKVHFYADHQLTRGQLAAFLYRAAGSPDVSAEDVNNSFQDSKTHQFKNEIAWLKKKGISTGDNGNFHPDTNIKRAEIAKLIVNAFSLTTLDKTGNTQNFNDVDVNDQFAKPILVLKNLSISTGDNGNYHPYDEISRGQMAKLLTRALDVAKK